MFANSFVLEKDLQFARTVQIYVNGEFLKRDALQVTHFERFDTTCFLPVLADQMSFDLIKTKPKEDGGADQTEKWVRLGSGDTWRCKRRSVPAPEPLRVSTRSRGKAEEFMELQDPPTKRRGRKKKASPPKEKEKEVSPPKQEPAKKKRGRKSKQQLAAEREAAAAAANDVTTAVTAEETTSKDLPRIKANR